MKPLIVVLLLVAGTAAAGPKSGPSAAQVMKDIAKQYAMKVKVVLTDKGEIRLDDSNGRWYWFQGATTTGDHPDYPGYKFATDGGVFYDWTGAWQFNKFQANVTIFPDVPPPTNPELQGLMDAGGYRVDVQYADKIYELKLTIPAKPPWVFQEPTKFYVDVDGDYWKLYEPDGSKVTHQQGTFRFFGERADKKAPWKIVSFVATTDGHKQLETVDKGRAWVATNLPLVEKLDSQRNDHNYDALKVPAIASDRDLVNATWMLLRTVDHERFEAFLEGWLPRTPEFFPKGYYWSQKGTEFSNAANHPNSYFKDGWCPLPQVAAPAAKGDRFVYEWTDKAGKAKAQITVAKQKSRRGDWAIVGYAFAPSSNESLTMPDGACK